MLEHLSGMDLVYCLSVAHVYTSSPCRKERDRAREEHTSTVNKMFSLQSEGDEQQGSRYSVIPQIQKVCEVVDGFIYVANAEAHRRKLPFLSCKALQHHKNSS